jgi:hypothetical protein
LCGDDDHEANPSKRKTIDWTTPSKNRKKVTANEEGAKFPSFVLLVWLWL